MGNSSISLKNVVNATVHVDNSSDSDRMFDISSDVNIVGDEVSSFQNGRLVHAEKPGALCAFAESEGSSLNLSFRGMVDTGDQIAALEAVKAFISNVRDSSPLIGTING